MDNYGNRSRRSGYRSDYRSDYETSGSRRRERSDFADARGGRSTSSHVRSSRTQTYSRDSASYARGTARVHQGGSEEMNRFARRRLEANYAKEVKKRKRRKILLIAALVLLALVLGGIAYGVIYYSNISANLHAGVDEDLQGALVDTLEPGDPFYMLLMGADRSDERENSAEYAGDTFRSDSMILCRIDPENKQVTMVSLHRDTYTDMGQYGYQKLNAAHALGGPAYAVKVVSEMAGVDIAHYAEIDFDGFREAVDALGGIEVDVPMTIDDPLAGGYVEAGLQTLNGDEALILCRSRHAYDDYGDGDRYRAANQRLVLAAVAKKILHSDVPTMISTVEALSKYIITDFEITEIIGLAQLLNGMDTENDIYTAMEPTWAQLSSGGIWYEYLDESAWQTMMERVDAGLPPTTEDWIDPVTGMVMASVGGTDGGTSS